MDNYAIAEQLSLLSKLMDIHGENSFKSKSYSSAAFAIEKLPQELASLPKEKISNFRGIGESVSKKIIELLEKGSLKALQELLSKTPEGVLAMMNIKGLGPKKIHSLWKEIGISTIEELKEACEQHRLADKKGFGDKTEQKILEAIHFQSASKGKYLYAQADSFAQALQEKLEQKFPEELSSLTGEYRRQLEIIQTLEWVTTVSKNKLAYFFDEESFTKTAEGENYIEWLAADSIKIIFHFTSPALFYSTLFFTTGSEAFTKSFIKKTGWVYTEPYKSEEDIFSSNGLAVIPPYLREDDYLLHIPDSSSVFPAIIKTSDVKGLIHSHSQWSDGAYTIEQMAKRLIELGFEYLVISDHSKAAFYANGLSEERIKEQHAQIDLLNTKLAPFKIFKSIECDILNDGTLDYSDDVLSSFDLVIASIHSNLDMDEEKAMKRLMGAVHHPYVTILGHMTGRILLRRNGYPVNHKAIIDACAKNKVAIEINASPYRLDMDWRWIKYALDKGAMLSINPDAHSLEEFSNIHYGVLVAQKGGLTKEQNVSSFSRQEFVEYLAAVRKHKLPN